MKRYFFILLLVMGLFPSYTLAQEIRGIETRRVIYEGSKSYYYNGEHNEYYGWEVTNRNSISLSVDIELWARSSNAYLDNGAYVKAPAEVIKTQTVVLKPGESYIFKREEHCSTKVHDKCEHSIDSYYLKYKAYKLH